MSYHSPSFLEERAEKSALVRFSAAKVGLFFQKSNFSELKSAKNGVRNSQFTTDAIQSLNYFLTLPLLRRYSP